MKKISPVLFCLILVVSSLISFEAQASPHKSSSKITQIEEFSGKVVGVKDGDTIVVMHNGKGETIRLYGIDAPEKKQDFGTKAKQFMSGLVFNKIVLVKSHGTEKWGRTIGEVFLQDGRNANQEIVKAGLAWWYEKYAPHDEELKKLQNEAQHNKQGLWNLDSPTPPWIFRKSKKK